METKVIQTNQEYLDVSDELESNDELVTLYLPSDPNAHPCDNRRSVTYWATPDKSWVFGYNHNDLPKIAYYLDVPPMGWTIDESFIGRFAHGKYDGSFLLDTPHLSDFYTVAQREYHRRFHNLKNINDAIPLSMHLQMFRDIEAKLRKAAKENTKWTLTTLENYGHKVNYVLRELEESGMAVDPGIFSTFYDAPMAGRMVRTKYNPYTHTGRPSNAWNGVNFAAIPKKTGARASFVSRYDEEGMLINFDFKSFHLYLLARYKDVKLPARDIHTWLGKQYFGVDELTPEQYEESKKKTFGHIYGVSDVEHIEGFDLFDRINDLRDFMWDVYKNRGYVGSGHFGRPIEVAEPSKNKVFNYWVQNLETETMMKMLEDMFSLVMFRQINSEIVSIQAHPILYTYDSILWDCKRKDAKRLIRGVLEICEKFGFPVEVEVGLNYNKMEKYILPD